MNNSSGEIGKYNISIQNPLILDDVFRWDVRNVLSELVLKGYISHSDKNEINKRIMSKAVSLAKETGESLSKVALTFLTEEIQALGFDGIKYNNRGEGGGTAWIAFDSNQIKLISGA